MKISETAMKQIQEIIEKDLEKKEPDKRDLRGDDICWVWDHDDERKCIKVFKSYGESNNKLFYIDDNFSQGESQWENHELIHSPSRHKKLMTAWVARDEDERLFGHSEFPICDKKEYRSGKFLFQLPSDLFPDLKFGDEPKEIELYYEER